MPYDPAEFNNPYTDEQLEKEHTLEVEKKLHGNAIPYETRMDIQHKFCELLSKGATVRQALAVLNGSDAWFGSNTSVVGRKTIYMWRRYDEEFREAWNLAYADGTERLEEAVNKFALEGNASLLQFSLKVRNQARYNPPQRQEISGPEGGAIQVERIEIVGVDPEAGEDGSDSSA